MAPGIIPPVWSITAPEIEPVIVCAIASELQASNATTSVRMTALQRRKLNMGLLLRLANPSNPFAKTQIVSSWDNLNRKTRGLPKQIQTGFPVKLKLRIFIHGLHGFMGVLCGFLILFFLERKCSLGSNDVLAHRLARFFRLACANGAIDFPV